MAFKLVKYNGKATIAHDMITPFGEVEILIKMKDYCVKDDIINWIFDNCGLKTETAIIEAQRKIQEKIERMQGAMY